MAITNNFLLLTFATCKIFSPAAPAADTGMTSFDLSMMHTAGRYARDSFQEVPGNLFCISNGLIAANILPMTSTAPGSLSSPDKLFEHSDWSKYASVQHVLDQLNSVQNYNDSSLELAMLSIYTKITQELSALTADAYQERQMLTTLRGLLFAYFRHYISEENKTELSKALNAEFLAYRKGTMTFNVDKSFQLLADDSNTFGKIIDSMNRSLSTFNSDTRVDTLKTLENLIQEVQKYISQHAMYSLAVQVHLNEQAQALLADLQLALFSCYIVMKIAADNSSSTFLSTQDKLLDFITNHNDWVHLLHFKVYQATPLQITNLTPALLPFVKNVYNTYMTKNATKLGDLSSKYQANADVQNLIKSIVDNKSLDSSVLLSTGQSNADMSKHTQSIRNAYIKRFYNIDDMIKLSSKSQILSILAKQAIQSIFKGQQSSNFLTTLQSIDGIMHSDHQFEDLFNVDVTTVHKTAEYIEHIKAFKTKSDADRSAHWQLMFQDTETDAIVLRKIMTGTEIKDKLYKHNKDHSVVLAKVSKLLDNSFAIKDSIHLPAEFMPLFYFGLMYSKEYAEFLSSPTWKNGLSIIVNGTTEQSSSNSLLYAILQKYHAHKLICSQSNQSNNLGDTVLKNMILKIIHTYADVSKFISTDAAKFTVVTDRAASFPAVKDTLTHMSKGFDNNLWNVLTSQLHSEVIKEAIKVKNIQFSLVEGKPDQAIAIYGKDVSSDDKEQYKQLLRMYRNVWQSFEILFRIKNDQYSLNKATHEFNHNSAYSAIVADMVQSKTDPDGEKNRLLKSAIVNLKLVQTADINPAVDTK